MDTTDKQKKKPPQKPKAVNTAWVSLITVISFALSVVMSYIGDARQSAGKTNRTSSRKIYSVCRHLP